MKYFRTMPTIAALMLCLSCNSDPRSSGIAHKGAVDSSDLTTERAATSATAATSNPQMALNDPARRIIKTADLRCRVNNVFAAITRTERLVAASGGQVAECSMENITEETRSLAYKSDSLRQIESFTTTAHLILRIPVAMLDTVLSNLTANATFINSRRLHLDDVTLQYLGNKRKDDAMARNDAAECANRLARKSDDAINAAGFADERAQARIDRQIENLQINEGSTYATLTVDLYQPRRVMQMIIPDVDYLLKPTLGGQCLMALNYGWQLFRAMFIGSLHLWPLWLIGAICMAVFRCCKGRGMILHA